MVVVTAAVVVATAVAVGAALPESSRIFGIVVSVVLLLLPFYVKLNLKCPLISCC